MKAQLKRQPTPEVSPLRYVKGVGPKRALALEKLGIHSLRDLLYFFPRRYEDRSAFRAIAEAVLGEAGTFRGEVLKVTLKRMRRMTLLDVLIGDDSGTLHAVWFNRPYLKNTFSAGQGIILYGRVDFYQNRLQISSPEYEIVDVDEGIHTGRITPIYPLTEGLFQRSLRRAMMETVEKQLDPQLSEFLPESFRKEKQLMELREAIREMHFPRSFEAQQEARRRMAFDEFLFFEYALLQKAAAAKSRQKAVALKGLSALYPEFESALPFALTQSQKQAVGHLIEDLQQSYPMNRLLQGDVGSGKTVVAAFGLFAAARQGLQGAFLVPTEILAEQHFRNLSPLFDKMEIKMALVTASTPPERKERILAELRQGKLSVAVGTHALLQGGVEFAKLGLLVIDEQHKFGVHQRYHLLNENPRPHQLVMTATPIPRTLALTIYGDLDVSVMKELPAGRKPIKTYWITRQKQPDVLKHIFNRVQAGDQAYIIFPLVEESEKIDLLAATKEYDRLRKGPFKDVRMGLVHGRLSHEERESTMKAFSSAEVQILVATSVVEVGVDNPNATMMVIENAERFGLSQLHQMRGRIGRGQKPSECFLFGEPKGEKGKKRLRILAKSQDGFVIAEEDLQLRGPGDFWGTRQSGEPFFKVANPIADYDILLSARQTAQHLVRHPDLIESGEWKAFKGFAAQYPLRY